MDILSEIFYWLFNMSISASISGIMLLLLGKIRKIPRRILHVLWAIPFLRMWIPIGLNSKYSLMSLIFKPVIKTVVVFRYPENLSMMNFVQAAETYFPITYKKSSLENLFQTASVFWIIIAAAFITAMCILYFLTKSELKDARPLRDNLYLSEKLASPAVSGIFHKKIFLPKEYGEQELKFILMHEQYHIHRNDNLFRVLAILTACIHWFNPLVWIFLKTFLANMELSCDEAVLKHCNREEKKMYASILLNCVEDRTLYTSAFGGAKVRVRIDRILSYKKLSLFALISFLLLAVLIGYTLLTNAM